MKVVSMDNLRESPDHVAGWFGRGRRFLTEVRSELGRVTWPTRREVWATTIVVILTSMVFGIYLFAVDLGLSRTVDWIIGRFGG
jgi:preprotein translocase subunit SecE